MSTYSPSLRVELITSGDQAGTWGNTTNDNFAYVFDAAIAGYQTVSVTSASQAFTYNNGPVSTASLNQSVYAMLRLTTTTGAAFSVYAPPVSKQYIIWNNSGYAATIYNSTVIGNTTAAGTGVTIADGDRVLVWSNGTNFYEIKTNNITGTVAIANGGTGQTTANAAFNALAPSQTGNNGRYLKSDGTNTSWDAIDLSTADITGVLPAANGGTGVNNGSSTITLGGNLVTSGAFNTTLTATNTTSVTLPTTGTLATLAGTEALTNKTISGSNNTLSNIANASLTNSAITINGNSVSLGGSTTITAASPNALTISTGLSGTSYNGSSAVTIAIDSTVATLTGTQTLTNKTLTSPILTTPALGTPSSGTLTNCTGLPNGGLVNSAITINGNSVSLGGSTTVTATATNALTIGTGLSGGSYNGSSAVTIAIDSTVATLTGAQTLTNKTISGASNTLSNIANASLTNSSVTINGNSVSLGGSTTVTAVNPNALTIGTGLSGGSYNGSSAVTVAIDSTVATLTGSQTLTNKTLTSPTMTAPVLGTPASGNLANCTFPTLNQNTTGTAAGLSATLAVASGGTGVTTSTGSGSTVLSASPTFTGTPAAPTASAGTNTTQIATTAFVQAALQALHPVGSIYINATNSTNPGTLLGFGTWTAFGAGRVPVGFDSGNALFDTAEETGGSADAITVSHTHTATTTITDPGHLHASGVQQSDNSYGTGGGNGTLTGTGINTGTATTGITAATTVASTGSSGTNANYQPYITVYMWKRTA
jgi:hypothetical protein